VLDPHPLLIVGGFGLDDGLGVEMPSFPALGRAQSSFSWSRPH
jgi:hypothetical protein